MRKEVKGRKEGGRRKGRRGGGRGGEEGVTGRKEEEEKMDEGR